MAAQQPWTLDSSPLAWSILIEINRDGQHNTIRGREASEGREGPRPVEMEDASPTPHFFVGVPSTG